MEGAYFQEATTEQRGNMKGDQRSRKEIKVGTSKNRSADEAAIRDLIENWAKAVRTRNLDGILDKHSPDILMFDVPPPLQSKGIEAYKTTWDLFFSWFQDSGVFDIREMKHHCRKRRCVCHCPDALYREKGERRKRRAGVSFDHWPAEDRRRVDSGA
jgi:SnoaL-like domain